MRSVLVAPSLLSADFGHLADQVAELEAGGADWLHFDVMDGDFVPNISMGPPILSRLRRLTTLPIDVHMMVSRPERYIGAFRDAGASGFTVHVEAVGDLAACLGQVGEAGMRAGVAVRPGTPMAAVEPARGLAGLFLVMTVEPGFGGQAFMPGMVPKIADARALAGAGPEAARVEVDGGINEETAAVCVDAGADVLVAGNYVFTHPGGIAEAVASLRPGS
ncbi:MAG: ribulose-phosphate 3-epimerase [Candidatus Dormibacteria bacterium]